MKVKCIETVKMKDGTNEEVFTEGKVYRIYSSTYKDGYDIFPCIRAKNNAGDSHILLTSLLQGKDFFQKHFELTVD